MMTKVLLIEDHQRFAQISVSVLEKQGFETQLAGNGIDGIRLADSFRPDIILLDIGLPDIKGYKIPQVVRAINGMEEVFIIALTAYDDPGRAIASGCDLYVRKPIDFTKINEYYQQHKNNPHGAA